MVKQLSSLMNILSYHMISLLISVSIITPCFAVQKTDEYVNLSSLQLSGKVSRNTKVTINFQSTRPLKNHKLFMELSYYNESMPLGGMFYYYPTLPTSMGKTYEAVEDGYPKNYILFLISEENKNEIKFSINYVVDTEFPYRTEYFNGKGKGMMDIILYECVNDDCSNKIKISNVLTKEVEFE